MHQVLQPADYVRKPWKNGGGVALDLHVEPAGAGMDAFDWRASIALVQRSGPFSHFPGVDRTIVLLEGTGMRLDSAGWHADMNLLFEPVHFPDDCTWIGHRDAVDDLTDVRIAPVGDTTVALVATIHRIAA